MNAATIRFGLLGHPVAHSVSPAMHTASFRALGLDATYTAFDITPDALASTVHMLNTHGYRGLNITVPHKIAVMAHCTTLDASAHACGAVNTLRFTSNGNVEGFNTDGIGFIRALSYAGITLTHANVFILGCGGVGRTISAACIANGVATLTLANRTAATAIERAQALASENPNTVISALENSDAWIDAAHHADIIIHCTTAGIHADDVSPLPRHAFRTGQFVFDCVAATPEPPTLRAARAAGADGMNGLEMLVQQGAESFRLWTGNEPDIDAMRTAAQGAYA